MGYVWIGLGVIVGVVVIGMLVYFAFNKKSSGEQKAEKAKNKEEVKETDVKEEKSSTDTNLELNENGSLTFDEEQELGTLNLNGETKPTADNAFNHSTSEDDFNYFLDDSAFDDDIFGQPSNYGNNRGSENDNEVLKEIKKMSPKMKAIILADVLDRKHF